MVAHTEMDERSDIETHDQDQDDEDSKETPMVKLDFEKLFKMAEDPDLEELLRSPLDSALINLENGKEVQQLTAIRSFPDILNSSEGDKCLRKMLPAIQKCLKIEKSNLDLHCEAAVVYKSVIQDDGLTKKFEGIIETLLENILQNIQNQKEHLSAAAWLETIVEVADKLSLSSIKQFIIPIVQQQAEPVQRVQRRIIAAKILHKLADILPPNEVRRELSPVVATLCKDANSNVRAAISQRLPVVAVALKNAHDVVACLLPCFTQLLTDEDNNVREAAMNGLTESLSLFTRDARKHTIFATIKKSTEAALDKGDEILVVIGKNFGKWSWDLNEVIDQLDKSWILNTYCKMVQVAEEKAEQPTQRNIRLFLKRACAFNLPCMLTMFRKSFDRLVPFVESYCTDHDDEVRMSIAASYHEILNIYPSKTELIPPFIELLHGGSCDVISKVANNMEKILPKLYSSVKENPGKTSIVQLDRLLIGCNQVLRNTGSWRSHEALLRSLRCLPKCVTQQQLVDTFVPLLKKEILNVRAIPCRVAACESLLIIMRHVASESTRQEIIQFLNTELSRHSCCYRRTTYIDTAEIVLKMFSKQVFLEHFLDETLLLTTDKISNIRIRAIRILPRIKSRLRLPEDNDILLKIEKFVREMLKSDVSSSTRNLLNSAAVELSRCETCQEVDRHDREKQEEEAKLWDEKRVRDEETAKPGRSNSSEEEEETVRTSGLRPPASSTRHTSPWRAERRAVAGARPQPVVTVRSQSPSPMSYRSASPAPKDVSSRPSRLPLSSAAMEREKLRKSATDTPPPPARSARSSSVVSTRRNDAMSSSTSSIESSSSTTANSGYGLRRSATSSTAFAGTSFTSSSSYSLAHSRSLANIRRPGYGLSHVSSQSTFERKPTHVSLRVRNLT